MEGWERIKLIIEKEGLNYTKINGTINIELSIAGILWS